MSTTVLNGQPASTYRHPPLCVWVANKSGNFTPIWYDRQTKTATSIGNRLRWSTHIIWNFTRLWHLPRNVIIGHSRKETDSVQIGSPHHVLFGCHRISASVTLLGTPSNSQSRSVVIIGFIVLLLLILLLPQAIKTNSLDCYRTRLIRYGYKYV